MKIVLILVILIGVSTAFMDQELSVSVNTNSTENLWLVNHTILIDGYSLGYTKIPDNIYRSWDIQILGRITEVKGRMINVKYEKLTYYTFTQWWNLIEEGKYVERNFLGNRWIPINWIDSGKVIIQ